MGQLFLTTTQNSAAHEKIDKFGIKEKSKFKKRLQEFLANRDSEKQINFLQRCRYNLTEEILAFKESEKYSNKSNNMTDWLFFEEKLRIIKKTL